GQFQAPTSWRSPTLLNMLFLLGSAGAHLGQECDFTRYTVGLRTRWSRKCRLNEPRVHSLTLAGPQIPNSDDPPPVPNTVKEDLSCLGIQSGQPSSTRKRPPTPSAAAFSPASSVKSPSPRASAAAIPTPTRACARPSPRPRTKTCPTRTSSGPFSAAPGS